MTSSTWPAPASQHEIVEADLNQLAQRYPALRELAGLYSEIQEVVRCLGEPLTARLAQLAELERAGLDAGRPLLTFADLPIRSERLAEAAHRVSDILSKYDVQSEAPAGEALSTEALWALAQEGYEAGAGPADPPFAGSHLRQAAGQALAGALQNAAADGLPAGVAEWWYRGYCPICGGRPDLGLLEADTGRRMLACARCDTLWPYRRVGCPFCGDDEHIQHFISPDERFRLSYCRACRKYLKQARWPAGDAPQSLLGLRIFLVGLDLDAQSLPDQPA